MSKSVGVFVLVVLALVTPVSGARRARAFAEPVLAHDTAGSVDATEIRRLREGSNLAIARHDSAGLAAIFAPNIIVVASTSVVTTGRDANAAAFAAQFRARPDVVYRRTPREVTVFAPWQMASESGTWKGSWTAPDGKVKIGGRYFAKWRKLDGRWMVESETFVPERCSGSAYCMRAPSLQRESVLERPKQP